MASQTKTKLKNEGKDVAQGVIKAEGKAETWRRLLSIARPQRVALVWGLIFLAISSGAGLAYPQIVRWMVDNVLEPRRADLLLPMVLTLFSAFLLQSIAGSVRYYLFTMAGEKIVIGLRKRLFSQILSQEVSFFDFNRTGELMSRLSSDCATLQNTVTVNVSMTLRNIGQVTGGLAFMFYTSWKLSLIMLVLIPPTALAAAVFGKRIRKYAKEFQASLAEASIVAEETIFGIRTVKSFVQEQNETNRYKNTLLQALGFARYRVRSITEFMTIATIVGFAAICFVLWFGGREVIQQEMTVGDLTQFLLYLMIVAIGVGSLGSLWGDLMSGVGASLRIFEILEQTPPSVDKGDTLPEVKGHIQFKSVHFTYPTRLKQEVIQDLNLEIKPGQMVALVGASGGGKSTIGHLLPRFYEPSSGEIYLDGHPLKNLKLNWLRKQMGIVSQEPVLISTTIFENIRYGKPDATEDEVRKAAAAANALEFIDSFPEGMQTRVGEKGIQLSGGQKQRVAIARAILKDPKILILDEATSNLDTESESLVQQALHGLMQSRTTLVIAHRLATVKNSDQILVVDQGHIVQQGKHESLAADVKGPYYRLLQKQFTEN
jgi:ABC transporter fused permease/ATP-binding protein